MPAKPDREDLLLNLRAMAVQRAPGWHHAEDRLRKHMVKQDAAVRAALKTGATTVADAAKVKDAEAARAIERLREEVEQEDPSIEAYDVSILLGTLNDLEAENERVLGVARFIAAQVDVICKLRDTLTAIHRLPTQADLARNAEARAMYELAELGLANHMVADVDDVETLEVYRCGECGYIEGEQPQAGCCQSCGAASESVKIKAYTVALKGDWQ